MLRGKNEGKIIDGEWANALLPKRKRDSHKGSYGRAAIVAGSMEYTGAAYLSMAACLRSGAGYTALFLPKELIPLFALRAPEALLCEISEGGRYAFNEENMRALLPYTAVAYGMGMGESYEVYLGARWLLGHYEGKLLLDADGLNSLAAFGKEEVERLWREKKCEVLLTPHVKEFSRLSGDSVQEITENSVALAKKFANARGVTLLLKNAATVITDGAQVAVNISGCSGQAKGGSGDLLSGLTVGLLAQGASAFAGGALGSYLAGKAAELAAKEFGEYALTASDCIACLGRAFLLVTENAGKDGNPQQGNAEE